VWHYLHNPTFSHFDTDRHTQRQTYDDGIYHPSIASHSKKHAQDEDDFLLARITSQHMQVPNCAVGS